MWHRSDSLQAILPCLKEGSALICPDCAWFQFEALECRQDERKGVKSKGSDFNGVGKSGDTIFTWDFSSRALALLATVTAAASITDNSLWIAAVVAFGLSHYVLSFYYAAPQIKFLVTSPAHQLSGVTLLVAGSVLYLTKFPLAIFFALHHAFNEGYLRLPQRPQKAALLSRSELPGPCSMALASWSLYGTKPL